MNPSKVNSFKVMIITMMLLTDLPISCLVLHRKNHKKNEQIDDLELKPIFLANNLIIRFHNIIAARIKKRD